MPVSLTISRLIKQFAKSTPLKTNEQALQIMTSSPELTQATGKSLLNPLDLYKKTSTEIWNAAPDPFVGQLLRLKPDNEISTYLISVGVSQEALPEAISKIHERHRKCIVEPIDLEIITELVRFGALTTLFECDDSSILWMFANKPSNDGVKTWFYPSLLNFGLFYYSYNLWRVLVQNERHQAVALDMAVYLGLSAVSHACHKEAVEVCKTAYEKLKKSTEPDDLYTLGDVELVRAFALGCMGLKEDMKECLDHVNDTASRLEKIKHRKWEQFKTEAGTLRLGALREELQYVLREYMHHRTFADWPSDYARVSDEELIPLGKKILEFNDELDRFPNAATTIDFDTAARCHVIFKNQIACCTLEGGRKRLTQGCRLYWLSKENQGKLGNRHANIWTRDTLDITRILVLLAEFESVELSERDKPLHQMQLTLRRLLKRQNLSGRRHSKWIIEILIDSIENRITPPGLNIPRV